MGDGDCGEFQIRLFQSWQLLWGKDVVHVAARQQRLIAALAIHGPRPRSYLVGLLWPEHPEPRALESLRVALHLITRQLPGLLINRGSVLSLSERANVDLYRVRSQIRQLGQAGVNGNAVSCLYDLRHADLLPGWYDDWVIFEQSRLKQDRLHGLLTIARESLARCAYDIATEAAEAALELEPLYERAVSFLMQAERQQGNNASALQAFERYQVQLNAEMGIAPSEAIRNLAANVRRQG
jgi:SARP family transcriptional regulator, regulator of embCAB operon